MNNEKEKNGTWLQNLFIVKYLRKNLGIIAAFIVLCVLFAVMSDKFLTSSNVINILRQISINAILGCGMSFVILLGGIDLSVGSIVGVVGCLSVTLAVSGVPYILAMVIGLAVGILFGLVNGICIAKGKLPAFIVTLATMEIGRGVAYILTGGTSCRYSSDFFIAIGNGYFGFIPIPVVVMAVIVILCSIVLSKQKFGRHIYGVGGNREAARFSGIKTDRVEILVYTICGLLAGIAGIVMSSRLVGAQPTAGEGYELDAIAAVVLGGTSMTGGVGTVGGTLIGALIIGVLNNGLNLLDVSSYWQRVAKGVIILIAVYLDVIKKDNSRLRQLFRKKNT